MNTPRPERDWELLSAFLDGELEEAERQRLEQRLANDAALVDALDELRAVRNTLRSVKPERARRNYTLSPGTAASAGRRPPGWFSPLRLASAAATLVMLATFAAGMFSLSPPKAAAPAAVQFAREHAADAEAGKPTPPPLIFWGPPEQYPWARTEGRGGGGGAVEPPMAALPAMEGPGEPEAAAAMPVEPDLQAPPSPSGVENLQGLPQPKATQPAEEKRLPEPTPSLVPPPLEGSGPILGIAPAEEQGKQAIPAAEPAPAAMPAAFPLSGWFVAAIIAALAAAAAWIADLLMRRRKP